MMLPWNPNSLISTTLFYAREIETTQSIILPLSNAVNCSIPARWCMLSETLHWLPSKQVLRGPMGPKMRVILTPKPRRFFFGGGCQGYQLYATLLEVIAKQ